MVDVLSTKTLLNHTIVAMEMSQMIIQSMWVSQNPLLQLPYFDSTLAKECEAEKINDISDFMNMEDDQRKKLLKNMNDKQIMDIAKVCNRYPISIDMKVEFNHGNVNDINAGENIEININLERDYDANSLTPVPSSYYHLEKEEAWWLIVGDKTTNTLLNIKRFTFVKDFKIAFKLIAPELSGKYAYNIFLICDSWVGCDQEEEHTFTII